MAKHAKTSDWSSAAIQTVDMYFGDDCRISQSSNCSHSIKKSDISGISVIIVFDTIYKCFVAFNGKIQSTLHQSKSNSIKTSLKNTYIYTNVSKIICDEIIPLYVKRNANSKLPDGCYEKIVLFKEAALAEFCDNYEDYLFPNKNDEDYHSPVVFYGNSSIEYYNETASAKIHRSILSEIQ